MRTFSLSQTDFSGGINIVTSPYALTRRQILQASNLIMDEHGALATRDGQLTIAVSPNIDQPITYHAALNMTDGTTKPFAIQSGVEGIWDTSLPTWAQIVHAPPRTITYATPQSVTMTDTEIIAAGHTTPWTYTGTTLGIISSTAGQTTPTGAKHAAFHLGSLWLWNTNSVTSTLDGPSSLRMSDPNNFNSWPNANQTFVGKDDGQQGMGLATYTIVETGISPTSTLVLFKNYSAYQVTGVFGASNFTVQRVKSDMGCIAPRSIQFVSGYGIIRLTHKGFALYNGVDDKLISEEIRPYIFGHHLPPPIGTIDALNFNEIDKSWAVQSQNPPLYICACPSTTGSAKLDRVFIFDLVRRSWTICTFPSPFSTLSLYVTPTTQPVIRAGTFTGGHLDTLFNGADTDNGAQITWSFTPRAFFIESPMRRSFWRRMVLDMVFTPDQDVAVSAALAGFPNAIANTKTFKAFTGSGAGDQVERRLSFDIMRTAPSMITTISGTGNVTIRGVDYHVSPKPVNAVSA